MKKDILKFFYAVLTLIFINACKKQKNNELETKVPKQLQSEPEMVHGMFSLTNSYKSHDDTFILEASLFNAIIYDTLKKTDSLDIVSGRNVGNVICNSNGYNRNLVFYNPPIGGFYSDNGTTIIKKPCEWSISGKDKSLPFNFTDYSNFPTYKTIDELPDTFYVNTSNIIQIKNYEGANYISVTLKNSITSVPKTLVPPANTLAFSGDEVSTVTSLYYYTNFAEIKIEFLKKSFISLNHKVYQINNYSIFSKYVALSVR